MRLRLANILATAFGVVMLASPLPMSDMSAVSCKADSTVAVLQWGDAYAHVGSTHQLAHVLIGMALHLGP